MRLDTLRYQGAHRSRRNLIAVVGQPSRLWRIGDKDGAKRLRYNYASEAEAKRAAGAARTRAARQPRSLDMTLAFGRADLFPECKVTTSGYRPEIDATRWLIAEVTHSWAERGFTTGLKLESS